MEIVYLLPNERAEGTNKLRITFGDFAPLGQILVVNVGDANISFEYPYVQRVGCVASSFDPNSSGGCIDVVTASAIERSKLSMKIDATCSQVAEVAMQS